MLPILLDLKFVKIYTFGVFLVLAFFWGMFFLWKNIKLTSYKEEEIFDGVFVSLAIGLFLGRLFYVVLNFSRFGFNPLKFILINGYPGLSLYGILIGGIISLFWYLSGKKINFRKVIDYFILPLFLALAIGKIGSFFSGVEVGEKTNFFLKIKYVGWDGSRHLTAAYEGLLFLLGVYFSYRILIYIRREVLPSGFNLVFFISYFSSVYLLLDKLKTDRLYFFQYDFNFFVSLIFFIVAAVYFIYFLISRQAAKTKMRDFFGQLKVNFFLYGKQTYQIISRRFKNKADKRGKTVSGKN